MKLKNILTAALVVPALIAPAIAGAAAPVRPTVKSISAPPAAFGASFVTRAPARAGAKVEDESNVFLAGLPLLLIVAGVVVVATVATVVIDDNNGSPS